MTDAAAGAAATVFKWRKICDVLSDVRVPLPACLSPVGHAL